MNHTAFFAAIKAGDIAPVYLMEGTEEYIKQQGLARLCERVLPAGLEQMNVSELLNPEADELIAAGETVPFMSDRRVVIVQECDLLQAGRKQENESKIEALLDWLPRIPPEACLVFWVKGKADGRKKLYTYLKKNAVIVDFSPMTDMECNQWVQRSLRAMNKQISTDCAAQFVFTVGRDAALLKQEMDKLAHYAQERDTIAPEDIDAVCTKSLECTVFQMVDAQVAGKYAEAFTLLDSMVRNGEDRMGILAMLLRQYRILYHMRCLIEERTPGQAQASLLGIPPFAVDRTRQQASSYSAASLKNAYTWLLQLEYQIKTGQMPAEGCAETALLQLKSLLAG